jgi:[ribosomal protein S5]-alanine N-acetyltransferase
VARSAVNRLVTPRLELVQLDFAAIDAWVARDGVKLEKLTGARFPEPVDAPPLFDADLPRIRDSLAGGRTAGPWLFILRDTREPVGAGGTSAMGDGTLFLGYSVWPRHQRRGYASEAVLALCAHGIAQPGVKRIRATIPIGHVASERVSQRAGLKRVGKEFDPDVGEVGIFEKVT